VESRCCELNPLRDGRWPKLVDSHPASSVFHSTEWLSALQVAYGYEPVVYTNNADSSQLTSGIVFCKVRSWLTGRRLVSLPFSDYCDPLVDTVSECDDLLAGLRQVVDGGQWDYFEVRPNRLECCICDLYGKSDRYYWHSVDLRPGIDEIFRSFHQSVRRKIRRAEREGLAYEEGNSERLLEQFYRLLVGTRRRKLLPPQPVDWFRSLIASFGEKLKIRVASKSGMPIASILTLDFKNTVVYKYGCSDAEMHSLGGVALLLWNTIQQAKARGFEVFDLGRTDRINPGLTSFKEHWGGIRSNLCYFRYPKGEPSQPDSWKQRAAERIVKISSDRMLVAMGSLLYRHIG
jgi:CelD/BcsL family acetyltransferase involved in cellulose biosynthesis